MCIFIYIYIYTYHAEQRRAAGRRGEVGRDPYTYLSFYLFMYLSIFSSIYLSINLSMHISIYLLIHPSIYLSFYLFIYISIYMYIDHAEQSRAAGRRGEVRRDASRGRESHEEVRYTPACGFL